VRTKKEASEQTELFVRWPLGGTDRRAKCEENENTPARSSPCAQRPVTEQYDDFGLPQMKTPGNAKKNVETQIK